MDVRLMDGEIMITESGGQEYVAGITEAVQRVMIAASAQKGAFPYNRSLGCDYSDLSADDPLFAERLELLLNEAAAGSADTNVEVTAVDAQSMIAAVRVTCGGESMMTEVDFHGYL